MLYELILINEIEQRAKIIFLSVRFLINISFCLILVKLSQVWNMRLSEWQHSIQFLVSYAIKYILFCLMLREGDGKRDFGFC